MCARLEHFQLAGIVKDTHSAFIDNDAFLREFVVVCENQCVH